MMSRSEIEIENQRQPYMFEDIKYANHQEYSEDEPNGVFDREIIRKHLICYDFGELDEYLRNHEQLLALKYTAEASLQTLDSANHIDKPNFGRTFCTSIRGYCNWYSWQDFEWNECFDFAAPSSYNNFNESELSQSFNDSSSKIVLDEYNEHYVQTEFAMSGWTSHHNSDVSNTSHNLRIQNEPPFEEEWNKMQNFFSRAHDSSLSGSSDFLDSTVSDEQYQADISSDFDEGYKNDDSISGNTSSSSHQLFDEFSALDKYRKRLGVKQRLCCASSDQKIIRSKDWVSRSTYSDLDNSDMQRKLSMHERKEMWKDKFFFEEVKAFYRFESSLSHNQIWTIYYDLDSYQIPRKWKRSLQQTQKGAREQIRQYFDELKSKFGTDLNSSTAISNNWQTQYDFLDYDCTGVYDDQHQADLSTSSDETLTRTSSCYDSDDQEYDTTPESIVKPRRSKISFPDPCQKRDAAIKSKNVINLNTLTQRKL